MNEQETAQRLQEYSVSIGRCERTLLPRRKPARRLIFVPLSVGAFAMIAFVAWPRDASAAAMQRFIHAVSNVRTMDGVTVFRGPSGKSQPFMRMSYEAGRWRRELLVKSRVQTVSIYKDEACYRDYLSLDHATIGTITENDRLPIQGEALEVVKEEFRLYAGRSAVLTIAPSPDIKGRAAYRVILDRKSDGRHVEIVVDKATDIPISADMTSKNPEQHSHTDYTFNKAFPQGFFDLPAGRKVVDLRKSIPARVATWTKPLVSIPGFDVLDAQVTRDGTVWLVTRSQQSAGGGIQVRDFDGSERQLFSRGFVAMIPGQQMQIYAFNPLDKPHDKITQGLLSLASVVFPPRPASMPENQYPSGRMTAINQISIPVKASPGATLPAYFHDLGLEHEFLEMNYWNELGRQQKFLQMGRYRESGQVAEHIADGTSAEFAGYENWMKQALRLYEQAGSKADQERVKRKIAHPNYSKGLE